MGNEENEIRNEPTDAAKGSVPCIQRKIDGRVYTGRIHFKEGKGRTAEEVMKSVLLHELDREHHKQE